MTLPRLCPLSLLIALALAAPGSALAAAGSIVSLQGKGEVKSASADWHGAKIKEPLDNGDFVRTGDLSQMAILLQDQTQIRLNQNSQLQIKSASDAASSAATALKLNSGRAWSAAKAAPPAGANFAAAPPRVSMETPSATMSIRGTDWEVEVGPDGRTQLVVLSGAVEIGNAQGSLLVGRGEAAVAEIGKAPVRLILSNPKERVQWVSAYRPEPLRILTAAGDDASPTLREAARLIDAGQLAEGRALLNTAPAGWPRDLLQADLKAVEGKLDDALFLARHAQDHGGGDLARGRLARLLVLADRSDEAAKLLAEGSADSPSADLWLARGEQARFEGDGRSARNAYAHATAADSTDARGWGGLGSVAAERERVAEAREMLAKAAALSPQDASYPGELGTVEAFADRYPEAEATFAKALELRPDDYVALTGRGVMRLKQGRAEEATEDLLRATVIEPRYARAQLYTGIAYYQLGRTARAIEAFAHAAELDTKDPLPYLYMSMVHTDQFEAAPALAAARESLTRMPYLKSLNQVANNQKGVANVGNALAFWGMKDWAMAYAQDGYYPYYAGSHLFLADLYDNHYAKNSELFQGFLADPTVFGASNRFQSLIHRPGNYQSASLTLARDSVNYEYIPRVTANGYSNSVSPFAYYVDMDTDRTHTRAGQGFINRGEDPTITAAVGWVPNHDLKLFAFYTHEDFTGHRDGSLLSPELARSPISDFSFGGAYFLTPSTMFQARAGRSNLDSDQRYQYVGSRLAGSTNDGVVAREFQAALRSRLDNDWELALGLETARTEDNATLSIAFPNTAPSVRDDALLNEHSDLGYVSIRHDFSPTAFLQADAVYTEYSKHVSGLHLESGITTSVDRQFNDRRWSPRIGFSYLPQAGHRVRLAYQDWVRPSSATSLGPVATAGIPLDDSLLRYGGRITRTIARLESEWTPRLYSEFSIDHRDVRNLDTYDISLAENYANLKRLRQNSLTDIVEFYTSGTTNDEWSKAYLASRAKVDQLQGKVNAALTDTVSGNASYTWTDSDLSFFNKSYYLPRHTLKLGATWLSPLHIRLAADAVWRSGAFSLLDRSGARPPYWSANASASWETPDKRYGVAAFIRDMHSPNAPTFYGVAASMKF
ncbi:MAG TPA: FecR domain-containing protein [Rhodocyclaceae bacterium]